jgi:hypothetical protein
MREKEIQMALLTKPNELVMKETYAGLIYGQPGVGKSTLALSGVNPVCIDVDRGMYRVEKRYQVPSLQVESCQQVLDLLNSNELNGFDTIVIDTLGKLVGSMEEYVAQKNPKLRQGNGQLTQQGWGQLKIEFRALIKLITGKNKSILFVAHESEEKEGDATKKRPDVPGSARKDIVKELDFMGYMEMSGNKRTISFSPSGAYYAKNSMGLDSVLEIPGIQTGNSFIKDVVVSAMRNRREQDKAQAGPYDELIKKIDAMVNAARDVAGVNEAYEKLAALDHIWDSKIYARSKISETAKAAGAKWDKAANRFVGAAVPKQEAPAPKQESPGPATARQEASAEQVKAQFLESRAQLKNIMDSRAMDGRPVFTPEECQAVSAALAGLKGKSSQECLGAINDVLEKMKILLWERLAAMDAQAPEEPSGKGETDDGFEDDIPWKEESPPKKPSGITIGKPFTWHFPSAEPKDSGAAAELDI